MIFFYLVRGVEPAETGEHATPKPFQWEKILGQFEICIANAMNSPKNCVKYMILKLCKTVKTATYSTCRIQLF